MEREASFGQWVLERRRELRLQRAELAAQLGCAAITLRKIETDERRPSQHLAALLAERLGLPPHQRATFVRVARSELAVNHLPALPLDPPAPAEHEHAQAPLPTNLPAPLTSFVGREVELAALPALLATQRLITLAGVGGVGKTRLAVEAGIRLVRGGSPDLAPNGVWLVELAALGEAGLVAAAIARAFRLPEQPGRSALELLQAHLAERRLLLILDNCEHLIEECATVAEQLLLHCWQLHILTTSREPLRVPGERVYPVLPLALPGLGELGLDTPAARLFIARMDPAGEASPEQIDGASAAAIAQICRQLDGIPLAIELAAPLVRSMPLAAICEQLGRQMAILTNAYRTAIPRHQTMHSALVWSYRLLAPDEQLLLASCAVFAGGWSLEAAQSICSEVAAERHLPAHQQLIAKSLLLQAGHGGGRRYRLLEPVRQFALSQLGARGAEPAARRRHAVYYLSAVARCEADLKGSRQREALGALARDSENVRAAWDWAAEAGAVDLLGQALGALAQAYEWLGSSQAGLLAISKAIAATRGAASAELLALLLAAQARFTFLLGDSAGAAGLLLQAQELLEGQSGAATDAARAWVLLGLGRCLINQDLEAARDAFTNCQALFQALGDRWGQATALAGLGVIANSLHSGYEEARHHLEQSVALYRAMGDRVGLIDALTHLSETASMQNRTVDMEILSREAHRIAQETGNQLAIARAADNLGSALEWIGNYAEAYTMLCSALAITQSLGHRAELPTIHHHLGLTALYLGRYAEARAHHTTGLTIAQGLDAPLKVNSAMFGLTMVALGEGSDLEARRLAEQVIARSHQLGDEFALRVALTLCAIADRRLGDRSRARTYAVAALRSGLAVQAPTHWTLWVIALLLVDGGAPERAAEAFALAEQTRHEDNLWMQDIALREIAAIIAALPYGEWAAAQAHWAGRDVWEAGYELLAELEADGWGTSP